MEDFLSEFEIYNIQKYSKQSWKGLVREKIREKYRTFLLNEMKKYKKLDYNSLSLEDFGIKDYVLTMNSADSRLKFRERNKCMVSCYSHFPSDQEKIRN